MKQKIRRLRCESGPQTLESSATQDNNARALKNKAEKMIRWERPTWTTGKEFTWQLHFMPKLAKVLHHGMTHGINSHQCSVNPP